MQGTFAARLECLPASASGQGDKRGAHAVALAQDGAAVMTTEIDMPDKFSGASACVVLTFCMDLTRASCCGVGDYFLFWVFDCGLSAVS